MKNITLISSLLAVVSFAGCRTAQSESEVLESTKKKALACPAKTKKLLTCLPPSVSADSEFAKSFVKELLICTLNKPEQGYTHGLQILGETGEPLFLPVTKIAPMGATTYSNTELKISLVHRMINPASPVNADFKYTISEGGENYPISRQLKCK